MDATSSAAGASSAKQTYKLIANPAALSPHVGKKLELTGTIEAANSSDQQAADAAQPSLRVVSGKVVAPSCDEK